ncbi:MAG: cytochrome c oxidase subunit 3 family protein [Fibrobacteres bacterium]|nr:cytochrome c oxidase subunit 3 family protein [Fibrobacterota bacterium]
MRPAAKPEAPGLGRSETGAAGQFADLEHERSASLLGMWTFLATEVLFFGGMFTGYIVYRTFYAEAFREAGGHLDLFWGGVNTAVLLVSSAAVAMAVRAAGQGRGKSTAGWFFSAAALGAVFIAIKAHEYTRDYREHLMPLRDLPFRFPGPHADQARLFFNLYFVMTGVHALHLLIGMGLVLVLAALSWRGRFSGGRDAPVEAVGLYWHFVDAVWVFLYPLFYLMGR